jgi:hypothetical protein
MSVQTETCALEKDRNLHIETEDPQEKFTEIQETTDDNSDVILKNEKLEVNKNETEEPPVYPNPVSVDNVWMELETKQTSIPQQVQQH